MNDNAHSKLSNLQIIQPGAFLQKLENRQRTDAGDFQGMTSLE